MSDNSIDDYEYSSRKSTAQQWLNVKHRHEMILNNIVYFILLFFKYYFIIMLMKLHA